MFTREQAQYQLFQQATFDTEPGVPNGILIPREGSFNVEHTRNAIDNPQVQADGAEREFALGNQMTKATGSMVPNLNFMGYLLKALCTTLTTTGAGPYTHVGKLAPGAVLYHEIEKGITGGALWYRYLNMVLRKLSFQIPIEGIYTTGQEWIGSGNQTGPNGTSLDITPTEPTGPPGEYANIAVLENAIDIGIITDLSVDVDRRVAEKRVHGAAGKAKELKFGTSTVRGTLGAFFESDALFAKARGGTITSIKATLTSGTDTLELLMPEVKLEPVDWSAEGEDGIMAQFPFRAIKKVSADAPITFTLINGTTAY